MTKASIGLGASIWANGKSHYSSAASSYQSDYRARSLPPPSIPTATTSAPAPTTPAPVDNPSASASAAPARGSRLSPAQAFHRFEQACQRLRWKFLDLQTSYQRAMAPEEYGFTPLDAERNFKIDFHEFYSWIEQAIVLLLHIFGVVVSRAGANGGGIYGHAYHHNVLKALEDELCPVHGALGRGDVNQALWKAKELRNRWKDAAEGRETPPLKMYDLTWIVNQVLRGLEMAYGIAAQQVEQEMGEVELGDARGEDEWEWMVESMDWEASKET